MVGQAERLALVPSGTIEHHDHVVIAVSDLVEEDLHAVGIDVG